MSINIQDIATKLNISTSTVSKALNGYTDVSVRTRDLVRQAAREMGYQPSAAARNLRRGRTDKIGLFLNTSIEYVVDYLSGIIPGAVRASQGFGKNLLIYTITDNDPNHLLKVCRAGEIDGVILFSSHYDSNTIDTLLKDNFPFVVMGREIQDECVSYVVPDYYDASYQAVEYLVSLGHQRIAFTTRPELTTANTARLQGYLDALKASGLTPDDNFIIETRIEPNSGAKVAEQLLELDILPTAIVAFHDLLAVDMVQVFQENNIRVPEDISVIGGDGLRAGFMTTPHITTIQQPLEFIGQRVLEIINQYIENPDQAPTREVVPIELVIRGSTGECKQ